MKAVFSTSGGRILRKALVCTVMSMVAAAAFAGSATYTYDSLGRVTTITYSTGVVITYTYDAAGNRVANVVTGAPT